MGLLVIPRPTELAVVTSRLWILVCHVSGLHLTPDWGLPACIFANAL